jgi:hypothetical protein
MICPNCHSEIETQGKFCPECGHELPQTPPPAPAEAPPPAWAQTVPPPPAVEAPPPAQAPPPAWAQTPPAPPQAPPAAPQWTQTQPPAPPAPQPQWTQTPPPGGYYPQPAARAGFASASPGALLALLGGVGAIGSAWLPWLTMGDNWWKGIDATSSDGGLANGYFLIAAGAVAAVCGLLLVLGLATSPSTRQLLALGAIAGGIGVCAVELAAYMKASDTINANGGTALGIAVGWGIYAGAGAGVVAALGGLLCLMARPGATAAPAAGSQTTLLVGVIVLAALVIGGVAAWPQISKQIGGNTGSPTAAVPTALPGESTAAPTEAPIQTTAPSIGLPTVEPTAPPTPSGTFWTGGYSSPELAMNQLVTDEGYTYGGDCMTVSSDVDYCSSKVGTVSSGVVYAIGSPGSEAEVWALLVQVNGKWYVADAASAADSPPWP